MFESLVFLRFFDLGTNDQPVNRWLIDTIQTAIASRSSVDWSSTPQLRVRLHRFPIPDYRDKYESETDIVEPRGVHLSTVISSRPIMPGILLLLTWMPGGRIVGVKSAETDHESESDIDIPRYRGPRRTPNTGGEVHRSFRSNFDRDCTHVKVLRIIPLVGSEFSPFAGVWLSWVKQAGKNLQTSQLSSENRLAFSEEVYPLSPVSCPHFGSPTPIDLPHLHGQLELDIK